MTALARLGKAFGSVAFWLLTAVGAAAMTLWLLNAVGVVQPLVVVSGSMSPGINTGDLLLATSVDVGEIREGDIATLMSAATGKFVTHRVAAISEVGGVYTIVMKGDANAAPDIEPYVVVAGDRVWMPRVVLPALGFVFGRLMDPMIGIPLAVGLIAATTLASGTSPASRPRRARFVAADPVKQVHAG